MIFGQTPTNVIQEPNVIRILGSDGNDLWADTNQYQRRTQSFLGRAKVSEFETQILDQKASMEPQKLPEPLETMDYISLQE